MANSFYSKDVARLSVEVQFDPKVADPDAIASALDTLLDNALSTSGILDEVGNPEVGGFQVVTAPSSFEADPFLTIKQKQAYCAHKGTRCPHCQGSDIEGTGRTNAGGDWYTNAIRCNACGAKWDDIYTLSNIEGTEPPKPKE